MTDWNAHFTAASSWPGFKVKSTKEFKKIVEYRASFLNDGLITHSFKLKNGSQVVCVKADTQGMGQSGATRTLATPPKQVGFVDGCHAQLYAPSLDGSLDEEGNIRRCPEGSIPRLVPSLKSLCTAKKLSHILRKGHPDVADDVEGVVKKYAFCELDSKVAGVVGGGKTTFTIWKPLATFTTSQIWMTATNPTLQTVEAGWVINQTVNGDLEPHSFIYYTTDNYANGASGYNLRSGVFVQTNNTILIGDTLPASVYDNGAKQVAIEVQFLWGEDTKKNPVIWFYVGGVAVGYYPLNVFPSPGLQTGANRFLMGGETNSENSTAFPDQMGSGHLAKEGVNKAASASQIQYYDYPPTDPKDGKYGAFEDEPTKWSVTTPVITPTGYSFFYGGPGTTK